MWLRFARKTAVASATVGIVVVEGRVRADRTLSIPGSESRPIYYDIAFETYRTSGGTRGRAAWTVDRADEQITPFVVEDESGAIWVSPELGHALVKGGGHEQGTPGRSAAGRYTARLIVPGDIVRIRGEVYEPRKAPTPRGLRAPEDRPLEILYRRPGAPAAAPAARDEAPAAPAVPSGGAKKKGARRRR